MYEIRTFSVENEFLFKISVRCYNTVDCVHIYVILFSMLNRQVNIIRHTFRENFEVISCADYCPANQNTMNTIQNSS